MEYPYDPTKSLQKLKVRVFRFLGDYNPVYLHCELLACFAKVSSRLVLTFALADLEMLPRPRLTITIRNFAMSSSK